MAGPDRIERIWHYFAGQDRLEYETQPESGTTSYTYYGTGNVETKRDAKGTMFEYIYDSNDRLEQITAKPDSATQRVTRITYEAGTDNRESATVVGIMSSTVSYDAAGRSYRR